VLHRDLKGENVVLGDFGEVVVLDWGMAKLVSHDESQEPSADCGSRSNHEPSLTLQGQALGTPSYMSPEQAAGRLEEIDCRTDVYGLGAVLYEILTGQPPFTDSDTHELLRKVAEETPPAPSQLVPEVPPPLEAVCLRAISKLPADRYASASEIAQEVQGWQDIQRRQAEEALQQSEALYHSLVETLPLQVWRKDRESKFTFGNQRFCEALSCAPSELIGKTDFDFFPAELAKKYRDDDAAVLASGKTLDTTEDHVTPRGERLHVQVVKVPLFDAHGETVGIQGIFWDVTERQRLHEALRRSEELYHSLVTTVPLGLWRKDRNGRFTFGNRRLCEALGTSEEEIIGKSDEDFFSPEDAEMYRSNDRTVLESGKALETLEEIKSKGDRFRIQVIKAPLFDLRGNVIGTQGIYWDVTEHHHLQEALEQSKKELARLRLQFQQVR
jgi:PAS domain S-box-containing protein